MALGPFEEHADDLAPGDRGVLGADWSDFTVETVRSVDHPLFDAAYARLWSEFGAAGEMERREVIAGRLAWDPARAAGEYAFLYEMIVVRRGRELVAVRDHTAILRQPAQRGGEIGSDTHVVVHLSHVLVEPSMRGRGLAGWLRALPLRSARECAAAAGRTPDRITLVAEMEHADPTVPAVMTRFRSYARAGFRVVDPSRTPYCQPDFRGAEVIDISGLQPVSLALVMRRVGREHECGLRGAELREIVAALHAMFAQHVRSDQMVPIRAVLDVFPDPIDQIALLSPLHATAPPGDKR